jgi:patatin-like phospholipase/acyl hydrolase
MRRYILSIDGGGVRNAFSMRFLNNLFVTFGNHIDMVSGISAGALSAALIAYGKSHIFDMLLKDDLHSKFFDCESLVPLLTCRYSGKAKLNTIQAYFNGMKLCDSKIPFVTTTYNWTKKKPEVFSSEVFGNATVSLVDVLNAATAACTYFPPSLLVGDLHLDAGIVMNNPSLLAYSEAYRKWPGDELVLLSIGCGKSPSSAFLHSELINYSTLDWSLHGVLDTLEQGPNQVYENLTEFLCDEYIRIDSVLEYALDDPNAQSKLIEDADRAFRDNETILRNKYKPR